MFTVYLASLYSGTRTFSFTIVYVTFLAKIKKPVLFQAKYFKGALCSFLILSITGKLIRVFYRLRIRPLSMKKKKKFKKFEVI